MQQVAKPSWPGNMTGIAQPYGVHPSRCTRTWRRTSPRSTPPCRGAAMRHPCTTAACPWRWRRRAWYIMAGRRHRGRRGHAHGSVAPAPRERVPWPPSGTRWRTRRAWDMHAYARVDRHHAAASTAWRKYVSRLQHSRSCQNNGFPRAKLARHSRYAVLDTGHRTGEGRTARSDAGKAAGKKVGRHTTNVARDAPHGKSMPR
jgi:hypothetical protein